MKMLLGIPKYVFKINNMRNKVDYRRWLVQLNKESHLNCLGGFQKSFLCFLLFHLSYRSFPQRHFSVTIGDFFFHLDSKATRHFITCLRIPNNIQMIKTLLTFG